MNDLTMSLLTAHWVSAVRHNSAEQLYWLHGYIYGLAGAYPYESAEYNDMVFLSGIVTQLHLDLINQGL